jgi:Xaa-Pro aminopeptidase
MLEDLADSRDITEKMPSSPEQVPGRGHPGSRPKLPERFCNLDRLISLMKQRHVTEGLVIYLRPNVFYLSGYSSKPSQSVHETNGYGAVVLSPKEPEHPILVVPDLDLKFFLLNPTWVADIRAYANMVLPFDMQADGPAFDRSVPHEVTATEWGARARAKYESGFIVACRRAMKDLGIRSGNVGFDDLRLARTLAGDSMNVIDAYGLMQSVRQVKTPEELELMRLGAAINERAITQLVDSWSHGMTWFDLNHQYHMNVAALGGFVHDPGGVIVSNPRGIEPVFNIDTGLEDFEITPGMNLMLDCHGTINQYCWDSGKTWTVEAQRVGDAALIERAAIESMQTIQKELVPGVSLGELQRIGRKVFENLHVPDWRRVSVCFHGLGLEHGDVEILTSAGRPDWRIEDGQVVATHVIYPGEPNLRFYLEDNAVARPGGGESLYSWTLGTLLNG